MPVSSTKTRSLGSICQTRSQKTARSSRMSARSCSLARSVFFYATARTAAGRGTASAGLLAAARCAPPTALCIRPACDRSAHSPAPARSPRPPHRSPACDRRHAAWHSVGPRRAPAGARGTPSRDRRQSAGRRLPATDQLPQPATPAPAGRPNRAWASSPPISSEMPPFYPRARCFPNSNENCSSTLSAFYCRVEFTELDAGVLGSELPIGPGGGGIAAVPPSLDVALQRCPVSNPVRQVAAEGAQLDLGHVQPRAVLGRVVDLETVGDTLGLLGCECLVKRGWGVGIELVHDQDDLVRLAVAPVHELAHEARPVGTPAPVGDRHLAPTAERLKRYEQVGGAIAHVFAVVAFGPPRPVTPCRARRQRSAHLAD